MCIRDSRDPFIPLTCAKLLRQTCDESSLQNQSKQGRVSLHFPEIRRVVRLPDDIGVVWNVCSTTLQDSSRRSTNAHHKWPTSWEPALSEIRNALFCASVLTPLDLCFKTESQRSWKTDCLLLKDICVHAHNLRRSYLGSKWASLVFRIGLTCHLAFYFPCCACGEHSPKALPMSQKQYVDN